MKVRLDQLLCSLNLAPSLENAQALIGAGQVYVNDQIADKSGFLYSPTADVRLKERCPYVSRGGLKLAKGLSHFHLHPDNWTCIDIGASTGGFTDCLLQHNVGKVYALDVAYGQLSWKIRQNPKVVVFERFNGRKLTIDDISPDLIDLAVMDVSFISITTLLPPLLPLFKEKIRVLALIKPQFELAKEEVGIGGVVSDPALHEKAIRKIELFVAHLGLVSLGTIASPVLGPKGNREFLIFCTSPE